MATMTPRTCLLTGATGFLGSNLAMELLASGRERVHCLVRPAGDVDRRLRDAVEDSARAAGRLDEIAGLLDRLVAVPGDLVEPGLGLDDTWSRLLRADAIDECWHAAASLRYEDRHRDEIMTTNVDGTRNVIEAAAELGVGTLNHISTAYVAGVRTGEVEEAPYEPTFAPNNWYEASKRLGEDLVVERSGGFDEVRIIRPSIVVGNISTLRSTSTSGYYGFLTGLSTFCRLVERDNPRYLDEEHVRLFLEPTSSLDLVPVDLLVTESVTLADGAHPEVPLSSGDVAYFHVTNPFPITLERARVGPESSIDRLRIQVVEDRDHLGPLDALLDDALDFYRPYLRNDKRFVRSRDRGRPPDEMRISDDALAGYSIAHFDDSADVTGYLPGVGRRSVGAPS